MIFKIDCESFFLHTSRKRKLKSDYCIVLENCNHLLCVSSIYRGTDEMPGLAAAAAAVGVGGGQLVGASLPSRP